MSSIYYSTITLLNLEFMNFMFLICFVTLL